jgi:hypothetical protein
MAILSFKFEQLFIVLVPELVVWFEEGVGVVNFPDEANFVEKSLSIQPKFVVNVTLPLRANPLP